ncbi:MAG: glycerol kinase GlpK [Rhodospirillales bacterium]
MARCVLAIDQGTTSSRAILFDEAYAVLGISQAEFPQHFPKSGWVEHDCEDIWRTVRDTCLDVLAKTGTPATDVVAIGITNQRETTVIWDRETGEPIHRAIVWQDRRTAETCHRLTDSGAEPKAAAITGLLLDPYFSGTKVAWMLDAVEGARARAEKGELAFGTIDSFLVWRLTGGKSHVTDATNASRTLLYDIHKGCWSDDMLKLLNVPAALLPGVLDCAADFGTTDPALFGAAIPILGIAGDQQAATIGQACFEPGMVKSTYGTGCFAVLNTGDTPVASRSRLLTTIAYQLDGKRTYALEGSIFIAGAAVQWLRDGLKIIERADQSGPLAQQADDAQDVYLVPAFVGLGAPYWDADCRGALFGLTRATGPAEVARAALESVCFQTRDLTEAMQADWHDRGSHGDTETVLRVDGGMVASDWTLQRLADILNAPVDRPVLLETTALGAAWLAGMKAGFYGSADTFARSWARERRFEPAMAAPERERRYRGWRDAVRRTLSTIPMA